MESWKKLKCSEYKFNVFSFIKSKQISAQEYIKTKPCGNPGMILEFGKTPITKLP